MAKAKREMAQAMKYLFYPIADIIKITGLCELDMLSLNESLNTLISYQPKDFIFRKDGS